MPGLIQPQRQITWGADAMSESVTIHPLTPILGRRGPATMKMRFHRSDYDLWQGGMKIQSALGYLTADEREFLLSGILPEEWSRLFKEPDDDIVE